MPLNFRYQTERWKMFLRVVTIHSTKFLPQGKHHISWINQRTTSNPQVCCPLSCYYWLQEIINNDVVIHSSECHTIFSHCFIKISQMFITFQRWERVDTDTHTHIRHGSLKWLVFTVKENYSKRSQESFQRNSLQNLANHQYSAFNKFSFHRLL